MSGFRRLVDAQIHKVALDTGRFADARTVIYDGETYAGIPAVFSGPKETDRRTIVRQGALRDNAQGLFMATGVLTCALSDLGGRQPEKGQRLKISAGAGGGFFEEYFIASSVCDMGMLTVELEAIDE